MIGRALVVCLLVAGCSELPTITAGQCGNGIVEAFEDCDSPDQLCVQCRMVCTDPEPNTNGVGNCSSGNTGYTCGYDDRCYAPSGQVADAPTSVPFPVIGFRVLDLDGDHFGDVVGLNQSLLSVRYGDARASLLDSYSVVTPPAQGHPALTHLDADDVEDDLIIPVIDGLVAFTGAFGVPSPRQFPLGTSNNGAQGRPSPFDATQVDDTVALLGPHAANDPVTSVGILSLDLGTPTFDAETTSLCGQTFPASSYVVPMSVAYKGANASFLAVQPTAGTTCLLMFRKVTQARGTGSCPLVPGVPLPSCKYSITSVGSLPAFAGKPVLADLDGDGCPSLLDPSAGTSAIREYHGTTTGGGGCQIASTYTTLPDLQQPPGSELLRALTLQPAIAGLLPDALVTTWGIVGLTTAPTPTLRPLYISDRPVDGTTSGDLTGDGETDMILTTSTSNIDLIRRVPGADTFLLYRLPTTGPVTETRVGDYDGDGRLDLAYSERLGEQDQLSIAYGTEGGLLPGVPVDAFRQVEYIAVVQVRDSTDPFNVVDDLIAIDRDPVTSAREVTLLHGSPNRTMLSFYGPPVPEPNTAFRGLIAGNFVQDGDSANHIDLVAFQTVAGAPTRVHVIPGMPGGRLGDAQRRSDGSFPVAPAVTLCGAADAPSGLFCLDHAKFTWWTLADGHDVVVGIDSQRSAAGLLFDPRNPDQVLVTDDLFPHGGHIRTFDTFDVDHDGSPEVVAAFEADGAIDGYVLVCKPSASGLLTREGCTDIGTVIGDSSLQCTATAAGRVTPPCEDPDIHRRDLVVACHRGQHSEIYSIVGTSTGYATGRLLLVEDGVRIVDVQLGDVNGDSIDDLVILDDASGIPQLAVHPQLPVSETLACYAD